jgi:hypothetical protein
MIYLAVIEFETRNFLNLLYYNYNRYYDIDPHKHVPKDQTM